MKFDRALGLYEILDAEAKDEVVDGHTVRVFRGSILSAYRQLNINHGHYSPIRKLLDELGCITMLQRGTSGIDSVIILHHPPDQAEYMQARSNRRLTKPAKLDTLSADVEAIKKLIGGTDIRKALADHEARIRKLEGDSKNGKAT